LQYAGILRAAGYADFCEDVITPEEFNHLSQRVVPVLTDARPFGKSSLIGSLFIVNDAPGDLFVWTKQ
jgi:hypothetical protein